MTSVVSDCAIIIIIISNVYPLVNECDVNLLVNCLLLNYCKEIKKIYKKLLINRD
jgi:hypothetical protein